MTTSSSPTPPASIATLTLHRGQLIVVSIIGLVLGAIGLFLPNVALIAIAIVFGIYLIASGIFRINTALLVPRLSVGARWVTGILGVLIVVAGVICLSDPFGSLIVLAFVIGIGWIAEGLSDIMAAIQGSVHPRWFGWLSGILAVLAGITMFVLPTFSLATFLFIGSILLIVVAVSTLLTMPRAAKA
jgi:uncharacterized membrane protein HdeD (DUF308 family)